MRRFEGRLALVTGGARGLGLAIVRRLAAEGAAVAVADLDGPAAEEACAPLDGAVAVSLDVRSEPAVEAGVAEAAERLGGLDVLVNNAGVVRDKPLPDMTLEDWDTVLEVNLRGYFLCARAALPWLRQADGGRIVNISSRSYLGNRGQANYSASKAGVIGFARALALELGRDGITVNAVAPGLMDTPLLQKHPRRDAILERELRNTPIRRLGTGDDVAAAVAYLAAPEAGYVSGDVLHVTGGRY